MGIELVLLLLAALAVGAYLLSRSKLGRKLGALGTALTLGVVASTAHATGGSFTGLTETQLETVFNGMLSQYGIYIGALFAFLAVMVGVIFVVSKLTGRTGSRA